MSEDNNLKANKNNEAKTVGLFYLISDAVGELVNTVLESVLVQFPGITYEVQTFPFTQHPDTLEPILKKAKQNNANLLTSLVKKDLVDMTSQFAVDNNLFHYDILHPLINQVKLDSGLQAREKPGTKHRLDDEYYRRIEALEFAVSNDDGKHPNRFMEADIVLLGISRTSKTPLSIYLANLGYKVANLPLVPESSIPPIIYEIDNSKIIGLTNDVNVLNKFRRERMRAYGIENSKVYSNNQRIEQELEYANNIYQELQCPIINVADRSIEETATLILMFLNFNNRPINKD